MKVKVVKRDRLKSTNNQGDQYEGMNWEAAKQIKGGKKMYSGVKNKAETVLVADKRRKGQTKAITAKHEIIEDTLIKDKIKPKYKDAHKYAEQHETKSLKRVMKDVKKMKKK